MVGYILLIGMRLRFAWRPVLRPQWQDMLVGTLYWLGTLLLLGGIALLVLLSTSMT